MRKFLSLLLALMMVASAVVVSVSAAEADAADTAEGGTATITLYNVKGESVTQTYAVGETFTAITCLNITGTGDTKSASLNGSQEYTSSVLELADEWDKDDSPSNFDYGLVDDIPAMLPVCGGGAVANAGHDGVIYYNASNPNGFLFNQDSCELIVTHYTVTAAGEASITNKMQTLAQSDQYLTRIVDRGTVVNSNFTSYVWLSEPAAAEGSTVSGTVTSYIVDGDVTLELVQDDAVVKSATVTGTAGEAVEYSIGDVADGDYTLRVSKANHATREYAVTVSGDFSQDAVICPIGDTDNDGKVSSTDAMMAYRNGMGKLPLDDYQALCADGDGDDKVTSTDAMLIYRQAMGKNSLW